MHENDVWGSDFPLSEKGWDEIKLVKNNDYMQNALKHSAICCSMLKRANQTALGLSCRPTYISDYYNEINFGKFEGTERKWNDIENIYTNSISRLPDFCGGDSPQKRAYEAVIEACKTSFATGHRDIVVFSHKTLIECILCLIYEVPVDSRETFTQEITPLSITHLEYDKSNEGVIHKETSQII